MQPPKNKAWTSPTLYFSPQTSPHCATVDLPAPPTHSQDPGWSPQTLRRSRWSQPDNPGGTQRQSGSSSAKIMTMVWNASSAHARHVSTKWRRCHRPNSPQCFCSIWSNSSLSGPGPGPGCWSFSSPVSSDLSGFAAILCYFCKLEDKWITCICTCKERTFIREDTRQPLDTQF